MTALNGQGAMPREKTQRKKEKLMKEPGLDNRHRDKAPPKGGEIQQKRSDVGGVRTQLTKIPR